MHSLKETNKSYTDLDIRKEVDNAKILSENINGHQLMLQENQLKRRQHQ